MALDSTDSIWNAYRDTLLTSFFEALGQSDYVDNKIIDAELLSDVLGSNSLRDAVNILRGIISEEKIELLRVRFRSYKYRKTKEKKTLQIEESTHQWIMSAKREHYFSTVDEALYHLLSPNYTQQREWREERTQVSNSMIEGDKNYIFSLLERLSTNDQKMVILTIERAFMDGWSSAKSSRSKKSSARSEATENYIKAYKKT